MNELIMIGTQLSGTQQTIAKVILFVAVGLWIVLAILNKVKGKDE